MLVNCFTIDMNCILRSKKNLCGDFGTSIPQPLQCKNFYGNVYLFCVDANIPVIEICKKYDYRLLQSEVTLLEIDESKYNNKYQIHYTYESESVIMSYELSTNIC